MNERCSVLVLPAASLARTVTVWAPSDGASDAQLPKLPLSSLQSTVTALKPSVPDAVGVNGLPMTAPFAGDVTVRFGAPRSRVNVRVTVALLPTSSVTAISTVYWPSVVMPCGEYGEVQLDVVPTWVAPSFVRQTTLSGVRGHAERDARRRLRERGRRADAGRPGRLVDGEGLGGGHGARLVARGVAAARRQRVRPLGDRVDGDVVAGARAEQALIDAVDVVPVAHDPRSVARAGGEVADARADLGGARDRGGARRRLVGHRKADAVVRVHRRTCSCRHRTGSRCRCTCSRCPSSCT